MDVSHTVDTEDPHTINFTFSYSGEKTLDSNIHWDFGDGQNQTVSGTTTSHTYAGPGSNTVKIKPTVRKGAAAVVRNLKDILL